MPRGKRKSSLSSQNDRRRKRRNQEAAKNTAANPPIAQQEFQHTLDDDIMHIPEVQNTVDDQNITLLPDVQIQTIAASTISDLLDRIEAAHDSESGENTPKRGDIMSTSEVSTYFGGTDNREPETGENIQTNQEATTSTMSSTTTPSDQTNEQRSRISGCAHGIQELDSDISEESDTETGVVLLASQHLTAQLRAAEDANSEPLAPSPTNLVVPPSEVGGLTIQCRYCSAMHFHGELSTRSKENDGRASFSTCCLDGKVVLTPKSGPPPILRRLYNDQHVLSREFKDHIRQYNNALAFASMVADAVQFTGRGPYTFNVHGQIYHYSGCLEAVRPDAARFAQLYILDSDMATDIRVERYGSVLSEQLMDELAREISAVNPFAKSYKMMKTVVEQESNLFPDSPRDVVMVFDLERSWNSRTHNIPVANEIAAVFVSPDGDVPTNRGIVVNHRDNRIRKMPILSPFVDPMTYPLLFPHGDRGWHPGLLMNTPGTAKRTRVSMRGYYAYLAHYRAGSILHMAGKLFQQFFVDAFCKVEENDLNYIRLNQKKLRTESYLGLMDHINNEVGRHGARVGKRIILPSSFNGGMRNKTQHYHDSMSMVAKFGKPDFFVTFTCNPQCEEITNSLLPGQKPHDRPDVVSRVFKLKLDELREDLIKNEVLGKLTSHIGVIEFQKRGLPHAHLRLTLHPEHKLLTPEAIDAVVSAEIPSAVDDPEARVEVLAHMVHGPCGDHNPNCPCMVDGKCSKMFPKESANETAMNVNGFPQYRRRNMHPGKVGGSNGIDIDDSWVVPYNRYLLMRYKAHINVEVCASIKCVKYLYKYIFKGHDAASLTLRVANDGESVVDYDEVTSYIETRYVGAPEAAWRLFKYRLQEKSHTVIRLAVHCQDMQQVVFEDGEEDEAVARAGDKYTTLTGFFELNKSFEGEPVDPDNKYDPRNYLYADFPSHFTFKSDTGWSNRQRFNGEIGRMHFVSPSDPERFYLRLLLLHVRGSTSFESLRTVNGVIHGTFKQAAKALGLTDDDDEWDRALEEAALQYSPKQLRQLFTDIMLFCFPSDAFALWEKHIESLIDDFIYSGQSEAAAKFLAYKDVCDRVDGRIEVSLQIPQPPRPPDFPADHDETETVNPEDFRQKAEEMYASLNDDQKKIADAILKAALNSETSSEDSRSYFVDGPGGSGKTYLYETLNYLLKSKGKKVVNLAWSGIAAQLLPEGMTAHSIFKLPLPVSRDQYMPNVNPNSALGKKLFETDVFIWDEAPMCLKHAVQGVDIFLRDLMDCDDPFGGKIMIFGGDFRQIPPIVKERNASSVVEASLKRSHLWNSFRKYRLRTNMRAQGASEEFKKFLLSVGDGTISVDEKGEIEIPENLRSSGDLIEEIFGADPSALSTELLANRAILCPKNCQCSEINEQVLDLLPGDSRTYFSVDTAITDPGDQQYATEFLHSLTPSGLPKHELRLKVGSIVMLLRNLNLRRGLCNGTRLIVVALNTHTIECKKIGSGETVLILRIDSVPCDSDLPFRLKRRQFPLKLCFSITIHKSQGQTFEKIGVYLPTPLFTHGHLYVALSRCRSEEGLKVLTANGTSTRNIVIPDLL